MWNRHRDSTWGRGKGRGCCGAARCLLPRHALGKSNFLLIFLPQFFFLFFLGSGEGEAVRGVGKIETSHWVAASQPGGVLSQVCVWRGGGEEGGLEFMTPIIYEFEICLARCHSAGQS